MPNLWRTEDKVRGWLLKTRLGYIGPIQHILYKSEDCAHKARIKMQKKSYRPVYVEIMEVSKIED